MPIYVNTTTTTNYEPLSEGVHAAVLAAVVDLGLVKTTFGDKPKVQFVWLTDEQDPETGKTKYQFERFTNSNHEKSSLRDAVLKMTGKDISLPENKVFDIESLIGTQKGLVIQHSSDAKGKTYGNVVAYMKPSAKIAIPADFKFEPKKKAEPAKPSTSGRAQAAAILKPATANVHGVAITDDEIPF